jgi:hypothetical protein
MAVKMTLKQKRIHLPAPNALGRTPMVEGPEPTIDIGEVLLQHFRHEMMAFRSGFDTHAVRLRRMATSMKTA